MQVDSIGTIISFNRQLRTFFSLSTLSTSIITSFSKCKFYISLNYGTEKKIKNEIFIVRNYEEHVKHKIPLSYELIISTIFHSICVCVTIPSIIDFLCFITLFLVCTEC